MVELFLFPEERPGTFEWVYGGVPARQGPTSSVGGPSPEIPYYLLTQRIVDAILCVHAQCHSHFSCLEANTIKLKIREALHDRAAACGIDDGEALGGVGINPCSTY